MIETINNRFFSSGKSNCYLVWASLIFKKHLFMINYFKGKHANRAVNLMQEAPNKPVSSSPMHSSLVLGIVMLGTLMGALDSTIVLLAFPVINDSLRSDLATSLWIILAYLLVLAVATTQMGKIGDMKQNIQFRLRNFHFWLSIVRLVSQYLLAHKFQSCPSGRRSRYASQQRRHYS